MLLLCFSLLGSLFALLMEYYLWALFFFFLDVLEVLKRRNWRNYCVNYEFFIILFLYSSGSCKKVALPWGLNYLLRKKINIDFHSKIFPSKLFERENKQPEFISWVFEGAVVHMRVLDLLLKYLNCLHKFCEHVVRWIIIFEKVILNFDLKSVIGSSSLSDLANSLISVLIENS